MNEEAITSFVGITGAARDDARAMLTVGHANINEVS